MGYSWGFCCSCCCCCRRAGPLGVSLCSAYVVLRKEEEEGYESCKWRSVEAWS